MESRRLLSVNVTQFHNDIASDGVNSNETALTPANVKLGSFGKLFSTTVDGSVYAEPLIVTGVTITAGPNTTVGAAGLHEIALIATENDSLYAIDAGPTGGSILWERSFLNLTPGQIGTTPGTDINNTLGATSITPVASADVGINDIYPVMGITGTPVVDTHSGVVYLVTFATEIVSSTKYYVQMLHAINLADGTDKVQPFLIGQTLNTNTNTNNNTPIYVYGNGDGSEVDPYNNTGKNVVPFNALRENQRAALSLVNGTLYVAWASHGDNGPYHGWVVTWNVANILTTGFVLSGVLNTSPNGGEAGIWMGGGSLTFEPDGSAFYFETGNGPANGGGTNLNAAGFPANGDYPDAVIKAETDPTTTATNQGVNGWGIKIVDYFIPYNQPELDNADEDFGSGQPLVLPASAGIPGHPNLLIAAGKEGTIYLLDRNNLGHYSSNSDAALNSVPNGQGQNTPPVLISGALSAPSYYNGEIYWNTGYNGGTEQYTIGSNGIITQTGTTPETNFGYLPGSVAISSDGSSDGIVWAPDTNTNELHAYSTANLSTELWNSGQKAGGLDSTGALNKFSTPTIANGQVYVGTTDALVVYGLTPPESSPPQAPVLSGTALSAFSVSLSWTDSSVAPNISSGYLVEELINGTYQTVTTASAGAISIDVGGLNAQTSYCFRIQGFNGVGNSSPSNIVTLTTTNTAPGLNLASGFSGSNTVLTYNGSAVINAAAAQLTNGGSNEAGSVFADSPFAVAQFNTSFEFQTTAGTNTADGLTFTLQGDSPTALGSTGGALGYGSLTGTGALIPDSVAIKFDLYNNAGEGPDSTGIYFNGAAPTTGATNLTSTGVNLHSGDIFAVTMAYNGTNLVVTLTDTQTNASATQTYAVSIPSYTGPEAYIGFTAGTGGLTSTTQILNWTFSPAAVQAPVAPSGLGGAPASATSITLSWTNNSTTQTGFYLDRATNSLFTQNLITQTLPSSPDSFTDTYTGLAPDETYYYRIRAFNTAGTSANSGYTSVSIPVAPNKPTDATVVGVSDDEIDLTWMDNAGRTADGYHVLRAVNQGAFTLYASLPALNGSDQEGGPQSPIYEWSDTNVQPGTFYEYHIEAYNISGYNDFSGTGTTTLTLPPALSATPGNNSVSLTWSVPTGAVAYNLYRGLSSGSETLLASNLSSPSYTDTSVTNGKTYFYYVTALNGNLAPLPAESGPSNELSALPAKLSPPAAPAGLSATAVSSNTPQVLLSWSASAGATSYDIYRSTSAAAEANPPLATLVTGTTYTDSAVSFGTTYYYTVTAVGTGGQSTMSSEASAKPLAPTLNFSSGFAGSASKLTYNGSAVINGTNAELTNGNNNEAASVFSTAAVDVTHFTTSFQFQFIGGNADGFTFTIQGVGNNALGSAGGGLGYGTDGGTGVTIGKSVAIKFDLYSNAGEGADSTGMYFNGASPTIPATDLTSTGVNLHSGNIFTATLTYNGTNLVVTITDTVTKASATQTYAVNIPSYTGSTAYVGFTAGTGGLTTTTNILNWTYTPTTVTTPVTPVAPTGLTAIATANSSSPQVVLNWNAAAGAVSYDIYRSTSPGTEAAPPIATGITSTTFTDTPPSFGITYYYEVSAVSSTSQQSTFSNEASAKPVAPVVTAPTLNFSSGFAGSASKLTYNGSAVINGANAELTNGNNNEAASVFSTTAVDVTHFTTSFQFQFIGGNADGFTFTIQGIGNNALGSAGGGLGYGTDGGTGFTIGKSVAIKFDLYSNAGEGADSTGMYVNGASPTTNAIDLTSTGVNLHSGNVFNVTMTYDGNNLVVTITDTKTSASATQTYGVNIPSYTGSTAYVGFTAGTGGLTTTTNILNWTFAAGVS